jgi:hypothetical protein
VAVRFKDEEAGETPPICRKSQTIHCIEYTLPQIEFELATLVVISDDYIGRCKSSYHVVTAMTALY